MPTFNYQAKQGPANIVEGSARKGKVQFRRFLEIALSSLSEVSYALLFARELGLLSEPSWADLDRMHGRARFLTWQLYRALWRDKP